MPKGKSRDTKAKDVAAAKRNLDDVRWKHENGAYDPPKAREQSTQRVKDAASALDKALSGGRILGYDPSDD